MSGDDPKPQDLQDLQARIESEREKAFVAWMSSMQARHASTMASAKTTDWKKTRVDPKKLGMEMGPILTEDQFRAYCKESGITRPHVMKTKK